MNLLSLLSSALAVQTPISFSTNSPSPPRATIKQLNQLLAHISLKWPSLMRSNLSILDLLYDPKVPAKAGDNLRLYVRTLPGSTDTLVAIRAKLEDENPEGDLDQVDVLELPPTGRINDITKHGALYLPYPYVVPGGRFQEMYAWDSFFIALGLLRDNQTRLARNILDNYIYQIEHYGTILNGNRSYYLTRSQLPFLTSLIKLILPTVSPGHRQEWLRRAISAAERYYEYWTSGSHLVPATGLSRFFDSGPSGSVPPEIIHERDPRDNSSAYERVKRYFRAHVQQGIPDYNISDYYDHESDELTAKFMDNDRAMRESGFDTSTRFGPFNSKILDFNPVCLNSLLALMERDLGELYEQLEERSANESSLARNWREQAETRAGLIRQFNWDEEAGMYFDYDFVRGERRKYVFGTTFLPLWTGVASAAEAARVATTAVQALEVPGGLATSDRVQGDQWDKPYIWAPLQLFAVEGLRKYGHNAVADRIAANFCSMALKTWLATDELWEKYNGVKRDASVELKYGYPSNEVGFGWTNAVFTKFYDELKAAGKDQDVLLLDGMNGCDFDKSDEEDHKNGWTEIGLGPSDIEEESPIDHSPP